MQNFRKFIKIIKIWEVSEIIFNSCRQFRWLFKTFIKEVSLFGTTGTLVTPLPHEGMNTLQKFWTTSREGCPDPCGYATAMKILIFDGFVVGSCDSAPEELAALLVSSAHVKFKILILQLLQSTHSVYPPMYTLSVCLTTIIV